MSLTDELYALDAGVIVGSLIAVTSLIVTTVAVVSIAQVFL